MEAASLEPDDIFCTALELASPAERAAYLDQACGDDRALRQRVERLLEAHVQAGSFLAARPEVAAATCDVPAEVAGTVIGPYKLIEAIGEGGMGTVWMAEQTEPIQRRVAVKVIKAGMDSKQVLARFEAERQALALMDHPNIARVLDAGTTDAGRPYFVMELVKGTPITTYCDDKHLSIRERLELFGDVCRAVQHAHQKGIIHRDLKPSNILIAPFDGKPVVKVIDFGVAKATGQRLTDATLFTGFGTVVGTPEYMSPEQAETNNQDIDTRSDIYSLGVLLYELLTGSTPLTKKRVKEAALLEVLRVIREEEPPKPSTRLSSTDELPSISAQRHTEPAKLTRLVRGELDWIVMKALEKDRNRRYETANGLAHDIERYLHDEPVQACPPSAGYRFRKFARRNKGPVLAASLVLLALVVGVIGTSLGLLRAEQQRRIAADNEQNALSAAKAEKKAKETAESREAEVKAVLDFVESKIFAAARPAGKEGGLGYKVTLRQAVESALPFVDQSFKEQPLIEARLRHTLGISFLDLGEAKLAADQFEKARSLNSEHRGPGDRETLRNTHGLAWSYADLGRVADAVKLSEETLTLMKARLGPDHRDTLSCMHNLAIFYPLAGRPQQGHELLKELVELSTAKLGPEDSFTLASMASLASSYYSLVRYAESIQLLENVLRVQKTRLGRDHFNTLTTMQNLSLNYGVFGRKQEAIGLCEETFQVMKGNLGLEHPRTLVCMLNLAGHYIYGARSAEALALLQQLIAVRQRRLQSEAGNTVDQLHLAAAYEHLGQAEQGRNNHAAGTKAYAVSVEIFEKLDQAGELKNPWFRDRMGVSRWRLGLCRKAERAVHDLDFALNQPEEEVWQLLDWRIRFLLDKRELAGAVESASKAKQLAGRDPFRLYNAACSYAQCAGAAKDALARECADEAMSLLNQAVVNGWKNGVQIGQDPDFVGLRDRDDFKKLLVQLEEKK